MAGEFALLQGKLSNEVLESEKLAAYTTFGIGGPARFLYKSDSPSKLTVAYNAAAACGINCFILGGGSNVLFPDDGYDGLVIKDECCSYIVEKDVISTQSGVVLDKLVDVAAENSLTGFEFAAGIPGNVGGAVCGNAGAFGGCIADILVSAVVYNIEEGVKIVDYGYFEFAYRNSRLKSKQELILSVSFRLRSGQKHEIADKINEHRCLRRIKHPTEEGCAGSVFKNIKKPELLPAGKLLEEAGVRGMKIGGAEVYKKHCNIIVNTGEAKAADVCELAALMQKKVYDKFNIKLEYELLIL